jgi:hypothetical protein
LVPVVRLKIWLLNPDPVRFWTGSDLSAQTRPGSRFNVVKYTSQFIQHPSVNTLRIHFCNVGVIFVIQKSYFDKELVEIDRFFRCVSSYDYPLPDFGPGGKFRIRPDPYSYPDRQHCLHIHIVTNYYKAAT